MSDSGISTTSNDIHENKRDSILDVEAIYDEEQRGDQFEKLPPPKPFLSRSVMNLGSAASFYPSSSSLSRSESTCSLASSIGSSNPVTVTDVRTLTNNYQRMLRNATKEIKKLNQDVRKIEQEQGKLLEENVDLALETKKLLLEQKAWKKDEQDLIRANEEFVSEVERLYRAEEEQLTEKENLEQQMKESKDKLEFENSLLIVKHQEEKEKLETEIDQLKQFWDTAVQECDKLRDDKKSVEDELSCSSEYIRSSYKSDAVKFESKIESLEAALAKEKERKETAEVKVWKMSQEIENSEKELENLSLKYHDNLNSIEKKVLKLKDHNEKLETENFEYVVENGNVKKSHDEQLDIEQELKKEISRLNLENQWLINNQKSQKDTMESTDDVDEDDEDMEKMKKELIDEKEKVKNLTSWKSQLAEKNKELKADNERLFKRSEYLEGLVNDEVTDIDEILTVINNIQVEKKVPDIKSDLSV